MDNPQVTDFELGWLVGIFDGEGSFGLNKNSPWGGKYTYLIPNIYLVNTKDTIINKASDILKRLGIPFYVQAMTRAKHQKPAKRLNVTGFKRVVKFLAVMANHFECRKDQVQELVKFVALRQSKDEQAPLAQEEWAIFYELEELNKRGN
jgi:hypothetical protein